MTRFDAARFSIIVRKETTDHGEMYVARVAELPDVAIYGETYDYAYEGAIETIEAAKEIFDQQNQEFPSPEVGLNNEYSGRMPIRTSKSLHRSLVLQARREGISLNAFVNLLLTREDTINSLCKKVERVIGRNAAFDVVDFEEIGTTKVNKATGGTDGETYVLH